MTAAAGVFRADADSGTAASAIFGMVAVVALDWLVLEPQRTLDEVYAAVLPLAEGAVSPARA